MDRYSLISTKLPREFVLLQGLGCRWGKCVFCDYHTDTGTDPYAINKPVLDQVTGCYGVLDIINSGSAPELDPQTIGHIQRVVIEKRIHTLWFETHYMYRQALTEFAALFPTARVKFRCGVETFDTTLRNQWKKGIPSDVTPEDIANHFQGVCLLCGTEGDTVGRIARDIDIALGLFEYMSVNLFCDNSTPLKADPHFQEQFIAELYPRIKENPHIEILLRNTDLGVG